MTKRKYKSEEETDTDGYLDVECPECEAIINLRFQKGRNLRRLRCPVCLNQVTLYLNQEEGIRRKDEFSQPLVQLK